IRRGRGAGEFSPTGGSARLSGAAGGRLGGTHGDVRRGSVPESQEPGGGAVPAGSLDATGRAGHRGRRAHGMERSGARPGSGATPGGGVGAEKAARYQDLGGMGRLL